MSTSDAREYNEDGGALEWVDNHPLLVFFVLFEAVLIVVGVSLDAFDIHAEIAGILGSYAILMGMVALLIFGIQRVLVWQAS
jgi:hypothetical protein